jgi:hypothetical protein
MIQFAGLVVFNTYSTYFCKCHLIEIIAITN